MSRKGPSLEQALAIVLAGTVAWGYGRPKITIEDAQPSVDGISLETYLTALDIVRAAALKKN